MEDLEDFLMDTNSMDLGNNLNLAPITNPDSVSPVLSLTMNQQWCPNCIKKGAETEKNFLQIKEKMLFVDNLLKLHEESKAEVLKLNTKLQDTERKYQHAKTQNDLKQSQIEGLLSQHEDNNNKELHLKTIEQEKVINHLRDQVTALDASRKLHEESIKAIRDNEAGELFELRMKYQKRASAMSADLMNQKKMVKLLRSKCKRLEQQVERLSSTTRRPRRRTVSGSSDGGRTPRRTRKSSVADLINVAPIAGQNLTQDFGHVSEMASDSEENSTHENTTNIKTPPRKQTKSQKSAMIEQDPKKLAESPRRSSTERKSSTSDKGALLSSKQKIKVEKEIEINKKSPLRKKNINKPETQSPRQCRRSFEPDIELPTKVNIRKTSDSKNISANLFAKPSIPEQKSSPAKGQTISNNKFSKAENTEISKDKELIRESTQVVVDYKEADIPQDSSNISEDSRQSTMFSSSESDHNTISEVDVVDMDIDSPRVDSTTGNDDKAFKTENKTTNDIQENIPEKEERIFPELKEVKSEIEPEKVNEKLEYEKHKATPESTEDKKSKKDLPKKSAFLLLMEKRKAEKLKKMNAKVRNNNGMSDDNVQLSPTVAQTTSDTPSSAAASAFSETIVQNDSLTTSTPLRPKKTFDLPVATNDSKIDKIAYITSIMDDNQANKTDIPTAKPIKTEHNKPKKSKSLKKAKKRRLNSEASTAKLSKKSKHDIPQTDQISKTKQAMKSDQALKPDVAINTDVRTSENAVPTQLNRLQSTESRRGIQVDNILNEMIDIPFLLTPFAETASPIPSIVPPVPQSSTVVPQIVVNEEEIYSPVVSDEENIPATEPLCTAFDFNKPSTSQQGSCSSKNITKPRRFSCEAPCMALPVPTRKAASKTLSSPGPSSPCSKPLTTGSLGGTPPPHWHNAVKTTTAETKLEQTDLANDILDNVNKSFASEADFDAENFLNELSESAEMEMGPIADLKTTSLPGTESTDSTALQPTDDIADKTSSKKVDEGEMKITNQNKNETQLKENSLTTHKELMETCQEPIKDFNKNIETDATKTSEISAPVAIIAAPVIAVVKVKQSVQTSSKSDGKEVKYGHKQTPGRINKKTDVTNVNVGKNSSKDDVNGSDSNNNLVDKIPPKTEIKQDEVSCSFSLSDDQLNVNLTDKMDTLIKMAVRAVKTDENSGNLDVDLLLNCVAFTITLSTTSNIVVPMRSIDNKSIDAALTAMELKFVRLIIILHRKKFNDAQLIHGVVLPLLLRTITRFGNSLSSFKSFVDISSAANETHLIKNALQSAMQKDCLNIQCTMSLIRIYTCLARASNAPCFIVDLFKYALLKRHSQIVSYMIQSLVFWPKVFKDLPMLGNAVLQGIRGLIEECNMKTKLLEMNMHINLIAKESNLSCYDEERSMEAWEKAVSECTMVLVKAKFSDAYTRSFDDKFHNFKSESLFDLDTRCAVDALDILSKEYCNSAMLDQIIERNMWPILNSWVTFMITHGKEKMNEVPHACVVAVIETVGRILHSYLARLKYKHHKAGLQGKKFMKFYGSLCTLLDNFSATYSKIADINVQFCTAAFVIRSHFCDVQQSHISILRWFRVMVANQQFATDALLIHRLSIYFDGDRDYVKKLVAKIDSSSPKYDGYKPISPFLNT